MPFRIELTYLDTVLAGAGVPVGCLGDDRFLTEFAVWSRGHDRQAAESDARIVTFDNTAGPKRPFPLSCAIARLLRGTRWP